MNKKKSTHPSLQRLPSVHCDTRSMQGVGWESILAGATPMCTRTSGEEQLTPQLIRFKVLSRKEKVLQLGKRRERVSAHMPRQVTGDRGSSETWQVALGMTGFASSLSHLAGDYSGGGNVAAAKK